MHLQPPHMGALSMPPSPRKQKEDARTNTNVKYYSKWHTCSVTVTTFTCPYSTTSQKKLFNISLGVWIYSTQGPGYTASPVFDPLLAAGYVAAPIYRLYPLSSTTSSSALLSAPGKCHTNLAQKVILHRLESCHGTHWAQSFSHSPFYQDQFLKHWVSFSPLSDLIHHIKHAKILI